MQNTIGKTLYIKFPVSIIPLSLVMKTKILQRPYLEKVHSMLYILKPLGVSPMKDQKIRVLCHCYLWESNL